MASDLFGARDTLTTPSGTSYTYYRLDKVAEATGADLSRLPFSIKVLMENALRQADMSGPVGENDVRNLAGYEPAEWYSLEDGKLKATAFASAKTSL